MIWLIPQAPGGAVLAPFLLAATLIELTPGPNMAFLALISARHGRPAGLLLVLGVTLGLVACLLASVGGLAEIAAVQPWVLQLLRWGGVAYMLWLAWEAWRSDFGEAGLADGLEGSLRLVGRGFLINVLNPKNLVFYLTILPAFIVPASGSVAAQALVLGSLHIAVAACVHTAIVLVAGSANFVARGRAPGRLVRAVFAVSLTAIALLDSLEHWRPLRTP